MYNVTVLFFIVNIIFIISLFSFLSSKDNVFIMFVLAELLNLSGILNYIIYFYFYQNIVGHSLVFIFFALGAAEAAIGLTIIINFVKIQNTISIIY